MPINGLTKVVYPLWVRAILFLLSCWLFVYDLLAYLPFVIFANPSRKLKKSARLKVIYLGRVGFTCGGMDSVLPRDHKPP